MENDGGLLTWDEGARLIVEGLLKIDDDMGLPSGTALSAFAEYFEQINGFGLSGTSTPTRRP